MVSNSIGFHHQFMPGTLNRTCSQPLTASLSANCASTDTTRSFSGVQIKAGQTGPMSGVRRFSCAMLRKAALSHPGHAAQCEVGVAKSRALNWSNRLQPPVSRLPKRMRAGSCRHTRPIASAKPYEGDNIAQQSCPHAAQRLIGRAIIGAVVTSPSAILLSNTARTATCPPWNGRGNDGRRPRFDNGVEEACEIIEIRLEPVYMSQLAATEHPIRQSLSAPVHCPYIEAPRVQIPGHFCVFSINSARPCTTTTVPAGVPVVFQLPIRSAVPSAAEAN